MNLTNITSDTYKILDSGILICPSIKESITLSLVEKDGTKINVKIIFIYNKSIKNATVDASLLDEDTLVYSINHNGSFLNFGFLTPQNIGHFNGEELFLNIRADSNSIDDSPSLKYTWYLKK